MLPELAGAGGADGHAGTTKDLEPTTFENQADAEHDWLSGFAPWLTIAALLVIVFFTLYPFQFSAQATALRRMGPWTTWFAPVSKDPLGWFLNVLLFFPFGVGLAWWERTRGRPRAGRWLTVIAAGFALSLLVEFLQLYLPIRDSSWDDVLMNTLGAAIGLGLFERCGATVRNFIDRALTDIDALLSR